MMPKGAFIFIAVMHFFCSQLLGQVKCSSQHSLRLYINNKERRIHYAVLSIVVNGRKITGKIGENTCTFPLIDSTEDFNLEVNLNHHKFSGGPYKAWYLNNGSDIILGKLRKTNKLLSVSKYNDMTPDNHNWNVYSKRFFIVNHSYTIDLDKPDHVKKLRFLILTPYSKGDGVYSLTQKVLYKK